MTVTVRARRKPDQPWIEYQTRTLDDLPDLATGGSSAILLDRYGGRTDRQIEATGFFCAQQIDGRWWLIDPDGGLFLHVGVCAVSPGRSETNRTALRER